MSEEQEEWRDVVGLEGRYQVSDWGRIKSVGRTARCLHGYRGVQERILKTWKVTNGYIHAGLAGKQHLVHRLVAEAFLGPLPIGFYVHHKDNNKANPMLANLAIVAPKDNCADAYSRGASIAVHGEAHCRAILTEEIIRTIRQRYIPGSPTSGTGALGREYGVSQQTVWDIVAGRTWRHLLPIMLTAEAATP